jgi:hypothetical protein
MSLEQPTNNKITLINFCNQHQIPYFYLTIKYITTTDGKMKKQISRLPKGYMEMTYIQAMALHKPIAATHINIILKNSPTKKIIVIDTDSPEAHQIITANPEINTTAHTTNIARPGHTHFYYEVDELPIKKIIKTSDNQDMDLIIDNIFEKIDAAFDDKPILRTRLDTIMKIFKPSTQQITPSDIITDIQPTKVILTNSPATEENTPKPKKPVNIELIERMVNGLNPKEFEQYNMWIQLAYCLYNLAEPDPENKHQYYRILNNFLKGCSNYNEAENLKFFYQIKPAKDEGRKTKIASLYYWLKSQNRVLYDEIFAINDPVSGDIDPIYFESKYKNNYKAAKQYFEQVYFKLNNPACYCSYNSTTDRYIFINDAELNHIANNFWITHPKNPEKKIKFLKLWKDDPGVKFYSTIKLVPPPLVCDPRTLNLFTGFVADKLTECQIVDISPITDHIKLLCEDNSEYAEYVINFLAHIIQRPAELTRTALVFKGAQGVGKGTFFTWFANKIIGEKYYYTTADVNNITVNNDHLNGKLLINLDEARAADTYAGSSLFKNKITEPRITLVNKYVKPFEVENYGRYVFFSTQDNPVKIENTDRRYVIFKTSDRYSNLSPNDAIKVSYFKRFIKALGDPNVAYSFMQYLRNKDISDVNWEDRPLTESYTLSRELNIPIFAEFIEKYCFETDHVAFTNNINQTTKSVFFTEFNNFLTRTKNTGLTMKERTFYIECKKYQFIIYKRELNSGSRLIEIHRIQAYEYLKKNRYLTNNPQDYQF